GLAVHRRQVGLGEGGDQPFLCQGVKCRLDVLAAVGVAELKQVLICDLLAEYRVLRSESETAVFKAVGTERCRPVESQRLQHAAVHLGDLDPQVDLVRGGDRQVVDDV